MVRERVCDVVRRDTRPADRGPSRKGDERKAMPNPLLRRRLCLLAATLAAIAAGSALRLVPVGLPAGLVKYGGGIIWGGMVYGMAAFVMAGSRTRAVAAVALSAAVASELFRLYATPDLDAFRRTLPGQLLLGRIFSVWNIVAYAAGIALAAIADRAPNPTGRRRPDRGSS